MPATRYCGNRRLRAGCSPFVVEPVLWLERFGKRAMTALKCRAQRLRLWPARRRSRLITKRSRPTDPAGYRITELGTFK